MGSLGALWWSFVSGLAGEKRAPGTLRAWPEDQWIANWDSLALAPRNAGERRRYGRPGWGARQTLEPAASRWGAILTFALTGAGRSGPSSATCLPAE